MNAKQNFLSPRLWGLSFLSFALLFSFLALPAAVRADALEDAARSLAQQVVGLPAFQGPVRIEWWNGSSLTKSESEALRSAFLADLAGRRAVLTEGDSAAVVRVSLRETPVHLLFVAAVPAPAGPAEVRMVQVPRAAISLARHTLSSLRLQKELLWRQRDPVLDAAEIPDATGKPSLLVVLGRESLSLFRAEKDNWLIQDSALLPAPASLSRDLQGEIQLQGQRTQIVLSGRVCEASFDKKIFLECRAEKEDWRQGAKLSAACDGASGRLIAGAGDWTAEDELHLESDGQTSTGATGAGPLEFPGPVLSLSSAADRHSAWAIVFHLTSGEYEVYRVTLACLD